ITEDHSWVDEQVKKGKMTQAEAEKDKRRNLLTRSVGTHPKIEVDTYQWRTEPDDQLLLCSDGLINMVPDGTIIQELAKPVMVQDKAASLVDLANANGGRDNITVVLASINPNKKKLQRMKRQAWFQKNQAMLKNRALLGLYGLVCLFLGYILGIVLPF
ncbi:MAG: serine/threonine-protein phosphatase, partial [Candidatus Hydrogenedentes bacterium]|nr:serine/threonine-protein phosphatase [Candidatus Hydrogenedentota bacterium]